MRLLPDKTQYIICFAAYPGLMNRVTRRDPCPAAAILQGAAEGAMSLLLPAELQADVDRALVLADAEFREQVGALRGEQWPAVESLISENVASLFAVFAQNSVLAVRQRAGRWTILFATERATEFLESRLSAIHDFLTGQFERGRPYGGSYLFRRYDGNDRFVFVRDFGEALKRSAAWTQFLRRLAAPGDASETAAQRPLMTWPELEIRFLSDERIQVTIQGKTATGNFAEMGFEDRRTETPRRAWESLRRLAEAGALDFQRSTTERRRLEKRAQEIRKYLRQIVSTLGFQPDDSDALPLERGRYVPKFKIRTARSFEA